jgi:hypothetical protein
MIGALDPIPTRCACPACVAEAGPLLLATGRATMGLRVLDGLPDAIREAVAEADSRGLEHGVEAARKARPAPAKRSARAENLVSTRRSPASAFAFAQVAAELIAHVEHLGADRMAELLGVPPDDLGPLLEGRVAPPASGMRRLREAVE